MGYRALIFSSPSELGANFVIKVRTVRCVDAVSVSEGYDEGREEDACCSIVVWNSSVFIPEKLVGGVRGARCAWWMGWVARTWA